jgi:hypothetical protein
MEYPPAPPDLARWLHQHFRQPPEEFDAGRRKLRAAVVDYTGCSSEEADLLLTELESEGYLRYAAEGRAVGGSPGTWIVYTSPRANPDGGRGAPAP